MWLVHIPEAGSRRRGPAPRGQTRVGESAEPTGLDHLTAGVSASQGLRREGESQVQTMRRSPGARCIME